MTPMFSGAGASAVPAVGFIRLMAESYSGFLDRVVDAFALPQAGGAAEAAAAGKECASSRASLSHLGLCC